MGHGVMSLPRLWAFLAVALPVFGAVLADLATPDLAYHLRAGGEILATGTIPTVDTFTFTAAGLPWLDQQWGSQVILAAAFQVGGWTGLVILRAAVTAVAMACLFTIAWRRGLGPRTAAWIVLGAFIVSAPALGMRPQLFGLALFALVLALVSDRRAHPRRLWLVPVIVAVWANLHGSFFFAPIVLVLAWLEDVADRAPDRAPGWGRHLALAVAGAAVAAALVNPFGLSVWSYALGVSTNPAVIALITEWQPTTIRSIPGILFHGSVLVVVLLVARRGRSVSWPTLLWLAAFFAVGAYAFRGMAWWAFAAVVPVTAIVTGWVPRTAGELPTVAAPPTRLRRRLNAGIAVAIVAACVALLPLWQATDPRLGAPSRALSFAPSGLTGELRAVARPGDRVFNPQPWGSWFEFAVPSATYAVDSRIELFPQAVWDDYARVVDGDPGWHEILDRWAVTIVVTDRPGDADLAARLRAAGWIERYRDADGALLVRGDR
jgi:hypothetical protein